MTHVRVVVGAAAVTLLLLAGAGAGNVGAGAAATSPALRLVDDTHTITVDVPAAWTDVDTSPKVNDDGTPQPWIAASTDLTGFLSSTGFVAPGMFFAALPTTRDTATLLVGDAPPGCTDGGTQPYDDGAFVGHVRSFVQCGGTPAQKFVIAATHRDGSFTAFVLIQLLDADDSPAAMIAGSFYAFGAPAVTPGTAADAVPPALVGIFDQDRNTNVPGDNSSGEARTLTIRADGSYDLSIQGPHSYRETGSVVAAEDPCVAKNVHTGTVEFRADGPIDAEYTFSDSVRGAARWTTGPDRWELDQDFYIVTLGLGFGDGRGVSAEGTDQGLDSYGTSQPIGACIP